MESDIRKDQHLAEAGIKLIRLKNEDLAEDYESIVIYLEDKFKNRARELNISINENLWLNHPREVV